MSSLVERDQPVDATVEHDQGGVSAGRPSSAR